MSDADDGSDSEYECPVNKSHEYMVDFFRGIGYSRKNRLALNIFLLARRTSVKIYACP